MPAGEWARCRHCHRHRSEVAHLSRRGRCNVCAEQRMLDQQMAYVTRSGPEYERYLDRQLGGLVRYVERLVARTPTAPE